MTTDQLIWGCRPGMTSWRIYLPSFSFGVADVGIKRICHSALPFDWRHGFPEVEPVRDCDFFLLLVCEERLAQHLEGIALGFSFDLTYQRHGPNSLPIHGHSQPEIVWGLTLPFQTPSPVSSLRLNHIGALVVLRPARAKTRTVSLSKSLVMSAAQVFAGRIGGVGS